MSSNPRVVNVSQEVTPTFAPAAPQQRTVVASADTGSAIAANLTGLAGQLIKQGMAGAKADKKGAALLKLQTALDQEIGKGTKNNVERSQWLNSSIAAMVEADDIDARDAPWLRQQISRTKTDTKFAGGRNWTVGPGGEILGEHNAIAASNRIVSRGQKLSVNLPRSTELYERTLGKHSDEGSNTQVINSGDRLLSVIEGLNDSMYTATPRSLEEVEARSKEGAGELESAIRGAARAIMNPSLARALGDPSKGIERNEVARVIQGLFSDLIPQIPAETLTSVGKDRAWLEGMAQQYAGFAKTFADNAATGGAMTAAKDIADMMDFTHKVAVLRRDIAAYNALPETTKNALSSMAAQQNLLKSAANIATASNNTTLSSALLAPLLDRLANDAATGLVTSAKAALGGNDALFGTKVVASIQSYLGRSENALMPQYEELLRLGPQLLAKTDPKSKHYGSLEKAIAEAKDLIAAKNKGQ